MVSVYPFGSLIRVPGHRRAVRGALAGARATCAGCGLHAAHLFHDPRRAGGVGTRRRAGCGPAPRRAPDPQPGSGLDVAIVMPLPGWGFALQGRGCWGRRAPPHRGRPAARGGLYTTAAGAKRAAHRARRRAGLACGRPLAIWYMQTLSPGSGPNLSMFICVLHSVNRLSGCGC